MLSPNHLIGGYVITGTFAAFAGENIWQTKSNIACVLVCSLLPDIDLPKSPISLPIRPLSRWINRKYGHRTITHSIWAMITVILVAWAFGLSPMICGIAFFSHLLLDMMTKSGVPILYPLYPANEYIAVIPSNPNLRFTTGEVKTEILIFSIFTFLSVLTYPLMQNGFWTEFNKGFGVPKSLFSEFTKSQDLLKVHYITQTGSVTNEGDGFLIACEREDLFHLWQNDTFVKIDAQATIIKSVVPEHSHKRFWFQTQNFIGIGADSLNNLLKGKIICELDMSANTDFKIWTNGIPDKKTSTSLRYPSRVFVQTLDSLPRQDTLFQDVDFESMRIQNELSTLQNEYTFKQSEYLRHVDSLQTYDNLARNENNPIMKEKYQKRRDEIHLPDKPIKDWVREKSLQTSLAIAKNRFDVEQKKRAFERDKEYQKRLFEKKTTSFVGVLKTVKIE